MIHLGDLARSFDAFEPQTAAAPASSSSALPSARVTTEPADASLASREVSISAEGLRQLQHAGQLEAQRAATLKEAGEDAEFAARKAHEMAYRHEVVVVPESAYTDLATSLYVSGTSPVISAASIDRAQSEVEQARMARIALYELEKARGTPPAEIYHRLLMLDAARPAGYSIALAG